VVQAVQKVLGAPTVVVTGNIFNTSGNPIGVYLNDLQTLTESGNTQTGTGPRGIQLRLVTRILIK
jgi:hypothetical protein